MKNLLKLLVVASLFLGIFTTASAQLLLGPGITYQTELEDIGIQARGVLGINDNWNGEADFNFVLAGDNVTVWALNVNGQYAFGETGEGITPYLLGGLNLTSFDFGGVDVPGFGTIGGGSSTEIGLNLGGGVYLPVSDNVNIFGEAKYIIGDFDRAVLGIGALFGF